MAKGPSRKKWCFGKMWLKKYLSNVVNCQKWTQNTQNLKKGDPLLMRCENTPRCYWPMARALDVYLGRDDIVRKVKIKTPKNELIRPSLRLCLLEEAI